MSKPFKFTITHIVNGKRRDNLDGLRLKPSILEKLSDIIIDGVMKNNYELSKNQQNKPVM